MPLIKNNNIIDINHITTALQDEGLVPQALVNVKDILDRNNGSVEHAIRVVTDVMHDAKHENVKLRAAETVLSLQEVMKKDGTGNTQPIINITINSPDIKIAQIYNPQR